jgi:hypothetical protein
MRSCGPGRKKGSKYNKAYKEVKNKGNEKKDGNDQEEKRLILYALVSKVTHRHTHQQPQNCIHPCWLC